MVTSLAVVTGLVATGVPAQATVSPTGGDFSLTLSQSDLSMSTADLEQAVTKIQAESAAGGGLGNLLTRRINEYAGAGANVSTAGWTDFNAATVSMASGDTGVTVDVPAAEVAANASNWSVLLALVVTALAGVAASAICTGALTASLVGVALVPVICQAFTGAVTAFVGGLFAGDTTTLSGWAKILMATLVGAVGGPLFAKYVVPLANGVMATMFTNLGVFLRNNAPGIGLWFGAAAPLVTEIGIELGELAPLLGPAATAAAADPPAAGSLPCDIYNADSAPCAAAYSMDRAMYAFYDGPLYQVQRASDNATADIGLLSAGGDVNATEQDSFCANTSCKVTKLYDQSPARNDLTVAPGGEAATSPDNPADAAALPITIGNHKAYGLDVEPGMGYRNNVTQGIAVNGEPEGMYMVASGTHANPACCFDFGNGEANSRDNGGGRMDAVNLSTRCWDYVSCTGNGPWVQADLEDGLFMGASNTNRANLGNSTDFVTALLKNNGQNTFALKGGDSQSGALSTWYDGPLPGGLYTPMKQEGGIILGTGGDNSNWGVGSFFEGVMTVGYPSDAADNAVQAGIVAAGYAGNSAGISAQASTAGPAVAHDGYASVYTVTSGGHLQETYDPAIGQPWVTQDMFVKFRTPPVMAGTEPVAVTHDGYTSVYTVDAGGGDGPAAGDLQETYLSAIGAGWVTQDLSALANTPPTDMTPTAVYHDGYTSVYTVNRSDRHLQETFLPALGAGWRTQDLSALTSGPAVLAGTSPVAVYHDGYTSVYAVNGADHLQETFLPALGAGWQTQDMKAKFGTPDTTVTPAAVYHSGYTSVYTVDKGDDGPAAGDLQETFLQAIGDPWDTQDMSAKFGTPTVAPGTAPVALFHTGYTSVYTVDQGSYHLQETFLPAIGQPWISQDMNAKFGTPPTAETPIVLLHADATGALTWTSVYTVNEATDHLQETYLQALGDQWVTKDLTALTGGPPDAATDFPTAGSSVAHDGYASVYTVDTNGDLQETYLTAAGKPWATQDLTTLTKGPAVIPGASATAVTHDGYTSVYTIDAYNGHLQETWLSALGQSWVTQDLTNLTGGPAALPGTSPGAILHDGYTSVYTVDVGSGHLQETWLSRLGGSWVTQDLTNLTGGPIVQPGTSPVAVFHDGYTSVYTIDLNGDLQETYLQALGGTWSTQDMHLKYGTPTTSVTPAAVFHSGYTSVYTVDASGDLDETYLPAIGDAWIAQDLHLKFGTPTVAPGIQPVALYHTGYTSVYTIDKSGNQPQETYLPAVGDPWVTQALPAPATPQATTVLLHYDTSGGLTWTSVFTVDSNNDLQETYLPALGAGWTTQDLSKLYQVPGV